MIQCIGIPNGLISLTMLHAGNSEYQEKLKSIVSSQKDTDSKFQFEAQLHTCMKN